MKKTIKSKNFQVLSVRDKLRDNETSDFVHNSRNGIRRVWQGPHFYLKSLTFLWTSNERKWHKIPRVQSPGQGYKISFVCFFTCLSMCNLTDILHIIYDIEIATRQFDTINFILKPHSHENLFSKIEKTNLAQREPRGEDGQVKRFLIKSLHHKWLRYHRLQF